MTTIQDIYNQLDLLAPFSTAMEWDNVGLLIGDADQKVTGCLLALDVTPAQIDRAAAMGAQLIVTHHPVIFHPLHRLKKGSVPYLLAQAGISVISAHTNLDLAAAGVNDALAERLGLTERVPFQNADGLGLVGTLPRPLTAAALAEWIKVQLNAPSVSFLAREGTELRRLAVVSGSGDDYLADAMGQADALLSGEVRHHVWVDAQCNGFPLFAAGHHATEAVVLPRLANQLGKVFPAVNFCVNADFPLRAV